MAALADFERFVAPFVAGAPVPAIHDAVLDASIEFCQRTRLLRTVLEPITLVRGIGEYEIDAPEADTQVTEVITAWLTEGELSPATRQDLDAYYPQGWIGLTVGSTGLVKKFYCRHPGVIRLVPALDQKAPRALTLEVAYAPTRTASDIPDILLNRYAEQLAVGALGRLHQHQAAYADPSRAVSYLRQFDQYCSRNADDSSHGFQHAPLRIVPER